MHYLDEALPDLAVVLVQSVGGGILQGDRLSVEVELAPGARALVTTQSATKVYRMQRNYATQRISARVGPGAHLELLTDYLIPYRGARLYSEVDLAVDAGAMAVYGSLYVLCPPAAAGGLAAAVAAGLSACSGILGGASTLAGGDGVSVRVLGPSQRAVQAALHHAWRCTRATLLDAGVPPIHSLKYGREPPSPGGVEPGGSP